MGGSEVADYVTAEQAFKKAKSEMGKLVSAVEPANDSHAEPQLVRSSSSRLCSCFKQSDSWRSRLDPRNWPTGDQITPP